MDHPHGFCFCSFKLLFCFVLFFPREVGGRKLILETRLANELVEFHGDFSQNGLQFWKIAFSAMTNQASAPNNVCKSSILTKDQNPFSGSDQKVIMLPCKCAPNREQVQLWLQAKKQYECLQSDRKQVGGQTIVELGTYDRTSPQNEDSNLPSSEKHDESRKKKGEKASELQSISRNGLSLPLHISPVKAASSNSSPKSTKCILDIEKNKGCQITSPNSPDLSTLQQRPAKIKQDEGKEDLTDVLQSPSLDQSQNLNDTSLDSVQPKDLLSPSVFPVKHLDFDVKSSYLLHSTPVHRRSYIDDDRSSYSPIRNEGIVCFFS